MIRKLIFLFGLFIAFSFNLSAQNSSEVLLQIGDENIDAEEFWAIYQKNSRINQQSEKTSLDEYLGLYINFKLKVKEAKDAKMDTAAAFIKELEGYRKQLANPYLVIEEVDEETVKNVYDRMQTNVRASHILLRFADNPRPEDTLAIFEKASQIRKEIVEGKISFAEAAMKYSEDPSANDIDMGNGRPPRPGNKGDLGYFGVFDMVYPFEEATFNLQKGEISNPVRTRFGYHLIYLTDKIPAIGEAKAAHIFIKNAASSDVDSAKLRIDELYAEIQNGKAFEDIVLNSDDKGSSEKGGELPWFRANRMVHEFIAAISKMQIGEISAPIKTSFGWHIVKYLDQRPVEDFEKVEEDIKEKLKRDVRSSKGKQAKIAQIKKEENFKEFSENINEAISIVDASFYSEGFEINSLSNMNKVIIELDGRTYSQYDFLSYLHQQKNDKTSTNYIELATKNYQEYADQLCLDFEEAQLEEKYMDFRLIMNEYREGILLFDLMDKKVWSKASADTLGLEAFFNNNKKNYKWKKRANVSVFHLNDKSYSHSVQNLITLGKSDEDIVKALINDSLNPIRLENLTIETGSKSEYNDLKWKKGAFYLISDENGETKAIVLFREILKPALKKLNETRGLAIADYQNHLEKEWIDELKQRYEVKVDKTVLGKLKQRDKK